LIKKRRMGRKRGPGKPPFQPTAEQRNHVEKLVGFGLVQDDIRQLIINPYTNRPIGRPCLRAKFKRELTVGTIKTNANVVQSLYQNCVKGNPTCQIWWTKCRMGWKETIRTEVIGKVKHSDARKRIADRIAEIAGRRDRLAAGNGSGSDPIEADDKRG
jgi:hypothetical protein